MEKTNEKLRKDKGITLIALVITIIVLLILAGVSISMLTGENGILTQAQTAKEETEKAGIIEDLKLKILEKQIDGTTIYKEDIETILIDSGYFTDVPEGITLDTELMTTEENGGYTIKVSEIYNGELKDKAPILAGEVLVPNEIEGTSPCVQYNGMLCKVLYNDETHGLQIVTADNGVVPDVILGEGDENVTADDFTYDGSLTLDEDFKKAATSYNNAVDNLNEIARGYMDEKAIDARCLGSKATLEDGKFKDDTSGMFTGTAAYLETYNWNGKFKDEDTNYEEDVGQINALGLNAKSGNTWLASRYINNKSSYTSFIVHFMFASGGVGYNGLCSVNSECEMRVESHSNGFRPVFLLSSDIIISSGDGSSEHPYIIE